MGDERVSLNIHDLGGIGIGRDAVLNGVDVDPILVSAVKLPAESDTFEVNALDGEKCMKAYSREGRDLSRQFSAQPVQINPTLSAF